MYGPAKVIMNTILGASSGGITTWILKARIMGNNSKINIYDTASICNGVIAGLVGITASCNMIENWAAVCIGCFSAIFYALACKILIKL